MTVFNTLCTGKLIPENFKESSDPIADFTSSLIEISKECIPQSSTNPTKSNPWYNDDCKEAIKQRKQALSKFKRSPNTNNFNDIKVFRAKVEMNDELVEAIQLSHDSATGPDEIHYQMLKHLPDTSLEIF